ncbi:MAG: hypothetical protein UMS36scaffold28_33 [Phage 59_13]|nr:MAG: hypothetical protein UMS36scaffold28_33 [Phage 59_13]
MSNYSLHRASDLADMPRPAAWAVIAVREIGMPAVVIGALLYICFVTQNRMVGALNTLTSTVEKVDANTKAISENQRMIIERLIPRQ